MPYGMAGGMAYRMANKISSIRTARRDDEGIVPYRDTIKYRLFKVCG